MFIGKSTKLALVSLMVSVVFLQGCTAMKVEDYAGETPKLDLFEYFNGQTKAYGQFQDRSGKVLRRFEVDINGTVEGNELTLEEDFTYNDGETQRRVWQISKQSNGMYIGKAGDVIGQAEGSLAGNALNWKYTLDLPYNNKSIHVQFDDWMFLHNDDVLVNRAEVTKFGFRVGEVTLFFSKKLSKQ